MHQDTLYIHLDEVDITDEIQKMTETEEIEIYPNAEKIIHINASVSINFQDVNAYFDIFGFIRSFLNNQPKYMSDADMQRYKHSYFYPFSCECGEAGCNSIWNGISIKKRKHNVEWRLKKEDGYHFLDKNFYQFELVPYQLEIKQLCEKILDIYNNKHNEKTVYIFDRYTPELGYTLEDYIHIFENPERYL